MPRYQTAFQYGLIVISTLLAYSGVRDHQFVWDTVTFVVENPWVHELSGENIRAMFTESFRANWHPLVLLSHSIDFALFSQDPGPHHLVNLAYHTINACLVFWLVKLVLTRTDVPLGAAQWVACLTAIIFAVHPQHVESVAWVVERKDVLYSLFGLACLITYLRADTATHTGRAHLLAFLFFCCALMSKPMAVTLPAILVLLDLAPLNKITTVRSFIKSVVSKTHYWLAALGVVAITLQTQSMAMPDAANLPFTYRALNAVDNSVFYLGHYIWPLYLSPFYPYPEQAADMLKVAFWLPGTVFLSASTCLCFWLLNRGIRWPLALFGFYLITLLPVSGLIHVGPAKATDHYVYLATLPLSLLTALACYWVYAQFLRIRFVTLFCTCCYVAFLIAIAVPQVSYWRNHLTLWGRALTLYPESPFAHRNMAAAYVEAGDLQQALFHGEKSLVLGSPDVRYVERLRQYVNQTKSFVPNHSPR